MAERSREAVLGVAERLIAVTPGVQPLLQVAILGIPRHVALEEGHVVAAPRQLAHQAAIGRGVAVAPGRGDREAEDDDREARGYATTSAGARSLSSTFSSDAARAA